MTEVLLETLLERLQRKLSLPDPDSEELALLADELSDAEGKILLYLAVQPLTLWPAAGRTALSATLYL